MSATATTSMNCSTEEIVNTTSQELQTSPNELISMIAMHLPTLKDVGNMRLASGRLANATDFTFYKTLKSDIVLYPTLASMDKFDLKLLRFPKLAERVHEICIVGETLMKPEIGYEYGWNRLATQENITFTGSDLKIIERINYNHRLSREMTENFIYSGTFTSTLMSILVKCPNLQTIKIRKLNDGEHVGGWIDEAWFKQLSFYRDDLPLNRIYYGDYLYDIDNVCVTAYKDELGVETLEPHAGRQANFLENVVYSHQQTRCKAAIKCDNKELFAFPTWFMDIMQLSPIPGQLYPQI